MSQRWWHACVRMFRIAKVRTASDTKILLLLLLLAKISVRDKGGVVYHFHVSDEIEIKIMRLAHRTNEGITNKVNLFIIFLIRSWETNNDKKKKMTKKKMTKKKKSRIKLSSHKKCCDSNLSHLHCKEWIIRCCQDVWWKLHILW